LLLTDITEAHDLQQQLERHKRLSSMGEMAAGLAHQLRTPLATALLYAGNLAREQLGEAERLRFAGKALERLRALERMIQDMLLFLRGTPVAEQTLRVSDVVEDAFQIMEPRMHECGIVLDVDLGATPLSLRGNEKALIGVLVNLLENALQACEPGDRIGLHARQERADIVIEVADSGRGMGAEVLERLFEPFFTTRTEGTGLGLAIVRSVVEAHGGTVDVESQRGIGSRFILRFPETRGDKGS
jgi:two-component system sensor histidine kinase FlrB